MSANGSPVLFHCAAGKDRTGFAAAIILRILGVPHEIVVEDYLLTNQYFLPTHQPGLTMLRLMKGGAASAAVRGFMEARPEYLAAAFSTIFREHGSFEEYIYKALDLTMHDTERLRALYLE
jgi:protein-tyrosine phosphatase